MKELTKYTAETVIGLLKRGDVSPTEMIDAAVRRIAETDHLINALPTLCIERAYDHAARLEKERGTAAHAPNYLYGLPFAVKDNVDVAGVLSTQGSRIYADRVPTKSDIVVSRLEQNGGIVIGKSNMPEFACGGHTFNDVFGTTRNPWNTALSAGGSSGGAAASLAAGQVWLATGNDFAGSIRLPASYCSVVGFRPSPGLVPRVQRQPFSSLSIEGTMARTVADAAIMFDAEVGWHPTDPLTQRGEQPSFYRASQEPILPARVAFSTDLGLAKVDQSIQNACLSVARQLEQAGAHVDETCPDLAAAAKSFEVLRGAIYVGRVGTLLEQHRDVIKPEVIENAEYGMSLTVSEVIHAEVTHGNVIREVAAFFEHYDLMICPVSVSPPFAATLRYLEERNGVHFENHLQSLVLTYALSMTCCPTMSIPCGFSEDGLPVGLQLVGRPRGERELFSAAAYIEAMLGLRHCTPIDPLSNGQSVMKSSS